MHGWIPESMAMMRRGGEEQFASMAGRGWRYPGDSEHRKGKGVAAFGHLADSPCSLLEYRLEARFYNYMQGKGLFESLLEGKSG
jgi:hypothetical protein